MHRFERSLYANCLNVFILQGELTITADMEALADSLFLDSVPEGWSKLAYPSLHGLAQWYQDLLLRIKELEVALNLFSCFFSVLLSLC